MTMMNTFEDLSSEVVEQIVKVKEYVQRHAMEVKIIFQDFQAKMNTTKFYV